MKTTSYIVCCAIITAILSLVTFSIMAGCNTDCDTDVVDMSMQDMSTSGAISQCIPCNQNIDDGACSPSVCACDTMRCCCVR